MAAISKGSEAPRGVPRDYKLAVATMSAQTIAIFSQTATPASSPKKSEEKSKEKKKRTKAGSDDDDTDEDDDEDEDEGESDDGEKKGKKEVGGKRLMLEGRVVQRAECRPVADVAYMKHKAEMIRNATKPQRTVIQLDKTVQSYKPVADHKHNVRATPIFVIQ